MRRGHRHEQAGHPELDQLVIGVVAGGGDRAVESGEIAAHRVGGAQADHPLRRFVGGAERRGERRDLDLAGLGQPGERPPGGLAHLGPLAERDQERRAVWVQAQFARRGGAVEQLAAVQQHDRADPVGALAQRHGRAHVLGLGELARLEHGVEGARAVERHPARAAPPQRPPAPDHGAARRQRPEQRLVGMGTVEDDQVGLGLADRRPQARAQAARPAVVVAGAGGRVRGDVLDREAHALDHRRGGRQGEEERLGAVAEPARDRHRAGQVAEPGAVRGREQDPRAVAGRGRLGQCPDAASVRS